MTTIISRVFNLLVSAKKSAISMLGSTHRIGLTAKTYTTSIKGEA
jgi:hypothetical protein